MILYFVRHGDPIYDPDMLTPLGERQAEAVGRRLAMHGIDEIYCSTSARAKATSKPLCEITKLTPTELDWMNESHAWDDTATMDDGKMFWCFAQDKYRKLFSSEKVHALGKKWYEADEFADTNFARGVQRVDKETDAFLEGLGYKHDRDNNCYIPVAPSDKRIAVFAHQGFSNLFLSSLLDIPYPLYSVHFDMSHTGYNVIEFREQGGVVIPKMLQLSNDSHLYAEHLPTKYHGTLYI